MNVKRFMVLIYNVVGLGRLLRINISNTKLDKSPKIVYTSVYIER